MTLLEKLNNYIAAMAPHHKERMGGQLLIQCRDELQGRASTVCYAIACENESPVAFGASVISAWIEAESCLGESAKFLAQQGYKLIEGTWHKL
jgi:hypothetical protein